MERLHQLNRKPTFYKTKRLNRFLSLKFIGIIAITLSLTACANGNTNKDVSAAAKITVTNEDVGFSLLNSVEPDDNGNIFISPTSVLIAMLMVYNGTDGETKAEIEQALKIDELTKDEVNEATKQLLSSLHRDDDKLEVTLANSLWINDEFSFQDEFSQIMTDYFDAEIDEININDPASADRINDWVKKATNDLIEDIVDKPLSSNLVAYLINALYFNGTWTHEFNEDLTYDDTFYTEDGEKEIPFMSLDEEFQYFETTDLQAIKLPYSEGEMTMQVYLPKEGKSIDDLVAEINTETWDMWQENFSDEVEGTVRLPKFKLEYDVLLNEPLQALGITLAFGEGQADFSPMVETTMPLYISEVKQKTAIEVDEKGTEAAAATSVGIKMTSAIIEDESFYMDINRPFLFAIYDEVTEHALFLGIMKNPGINN